MISLTRISALSLAILLGSHTLATAASRPAEEAAHGMVVTSQHLASDIGAEILKAGGNAVDAAVAIGYVEAVTNACCGNIGGGGFMTVHLADGRDIFINFREMAPNASTRDMYLDKEGKPVPGASLVGYLSAGVPGTVLGLDSALTHYGTMTRAQVMAPAIRLAREGFVLNRGDTDILDAGAKKLKANPEAAKIFLKPDGSTFKPGETLIHSDLAQTLEAIATAGPDAFYKRALPKTIEEASRANGGILTAEDFAAYRVSEMEPVRCTYRGYAVVSAPPPSSGGVTLCEILNILEGYDLKALGFHSAQSIHLITEAMRHAYLDRNTYLGDPAFVKNPLDRLLSKDYAAKIRAEILPDKASVSKDVQPGTGPHEKPETTHYSVMDDKGNAVSVTYTINGLFGAGVSAPGTGFLLNDEMDDFTIKVGVPNLFGLVQGDANKIAPGKRPLSSMAPTLLTKDGKIVAVLGSPGGSRIITITLETILNLVDYGMAPQEAVDAPRFHHQWLPDQIFVEPYAVSPDTRKLLEAMGYKIEEQTPWGAAELIVAPLQTDKSTTASSGNDSALSLSGRAGLIYGANDNRRPSGSAVGY